jgi:omega-amidase
MELIGLQTDIAWHNRSRNHSSVTALIEKAKPAAGALVVLPEMFASGFSGDVVAATEGAEESEAFLSTLAKRYGVAVMAGLATLSGEKGANVSVTFGPDGKELARYRKLQPFSFSKECEIYPAGNRVVTFQWGGFTVAPFICYDLRFPEIFRVAAERGADLIAVVANWPNRRHYHWSTLLRARAIENMAGLIGVNRAGTDPEFTYDGGSVILGPQAEVLAEADNSHAFIKATLLPETVAEWRNAFPALRDRRSDISSL